MAPAKKFADTFGPFAQCSPASQPILLCPVRDLRIYFAFFIYRTKHARRFKQKSQAEMLKCWKAKAKGETS